MASTATATGVIFSVAIGVMTATASLEAQFPEIGSHTTRPDDRDEDRPILNAQHRPRVAIMPFELNGVPQLDSVGAIAAGAHQQTELIFVERQDLEPLRGFRKDPLIDADPHRLHQADAYIRGEIIPRAGQFSIQARMVSVKSRVLAAVEVKVEATDWRDRERLREMMRMLEDEFIGSYAGKLKIRSKVPPGTIVTLEPIAPTAAADFESKSRSEILTKENGCTVENVIPGWYFVTFERQGYVFDKGQLTVRDFEVDGNYRLCRVSKGECRAGSERELSHIVKIEEGSVYSFENEIEYKLGLGSIDTVEVQSIGRDGPDESWMLDDEALGFKLFLVSEALVLNRSREYDGKSRSFSARVVRPGTISWHESSNDGCLIVDGYRGEELPIGRYKTIFWHKDYKTKIGEVTVKRRQEGGDVALGSVLLERVQTEVRVALDQALPGTQLVFRCDGELITRILGEEREFSVELPVGQCSVSIDLPRLADWQTAFEVEAQREEQPSLEVLLASEGELLKEALHKDDCRPEKGCCFEEFLDMAGSRKTGIRSTSKPIEIKTVPWVASFIGTSASRIFDRFSIPFEGLREVEWFDGHRELEKGFSGVLANSLPTHWNSYRPESSSESELAEHLDLVILDQRSLKPVVDNQELVETFKDFLVRGGSTLILASEVDSFLGAFLEGIEVLKLEKRREIRLYAPADRPGKMWLPGRGNGALKISFSQEKTFPKVEVGGQWNVLAWRSKSQPWIVKTNYGKGSIYLWFVEPFFVSSETTVEFFPPTGEHNAIFASILEQLVEDTKKSLMDRRGASLFAPRQPQM